MADRIKYFIKDFIENGISYELRRREYALTRTQMRRLKDRRAMRMRKRAEAKKARFKQTYREKRSYGEPPL